MASISLALRSSSSRFFLSFSALYASSSWRFLSFASCKKRKQSNEAGTGVFLWFFRLAQTAEK
jgi:hypothetical protein